MDENIKKEILIQFGNNLRNARVEKGYSQEKLANEIGVEISQISRIERGVINTSVTTIFHISRALNISPGQLFVFK